MYPFFQMKTHRPQMLNNSFKMTELVSNSTRPPYDPLAPVPEFPSLGSISQMRKQGPWNFASCLQTERRFLAKIRAQCPWQLVKKDKLFILKMQKGSGIRPLLAVSPMEVPWRCSWWHRGDGCGAGNEWVHGPRCRARLQQKNKINKRIRFLESPEHLGDPEGAGRVSVWLLVRGEGVSPAMGHILPGCPTVNHTCLFKGNTHYSNTYLLHSLTRCARPLWTGAVLSSHYWTIFFPIDTFIQVKCCF